MNLCRLHPWHSEIHQDHVLNHFPIDLLFLKNIYVKYLYLDRRAQRETVRASFHEQAIDIHQTHEVYRP